MLCFSIFFVRTRSWPCGFLSLPCYSKFLNVRKSIKNNESFTHVMMTMMTGWSVAEFGANVFFAFLVIQLLGESETK